MTAMEAVFMREEEGFSSTLLGLAENTSIWAFLHLYGLRKLPKYLLRKSLGSAHKIR